MSDSASQLLHTAQAHHRAGELEQAFELYQQALAIEPTNAEIYDLIGQLALQGGQAQLAEEFFQTAITFAPQSTNYLRNLAVTYFSQGNNKLAKETYRKALEVDNQDADAYLNLGRILRLERRYDEAFKALEQAVLLRKGDAEPLAAYADTLLAAEQYQKAERTANAAVALDPQNPLALTTLCSALAYLNRPQEAAHWGRQAVEIEPDNAKNHINLAAACVELGKYPEAERHAQRGMELAPDSPEAISIMATVLFRTHKWEESLELIEKAIHLAPNSHHFLAQKAALLERMGRADEAFALLKPVVTSGKALNTAIIETFANAARQPADLKLAAELCEKVLAHKNIPDVVRTPIFFLVARILDKLGEYDKAFGYLQQGNAMKQRQYVPKTAETLIRHEIETFSSALFAAAPRPAHSSRRPIFIIGMPRSGTSLTEKILASHPQVFAGGELSEVEFICRDLQSLVQSNYPYPICASELDQSGLEQITQRYLGFIDSLVPEGESPAHITDKMPQNFLHLGLIRLMFPEATIIHCVRDPIDTCLSCYMQNFSSEGLKFAYDLDNLAHYYGLYQKLMAHWREVLPGGFHDLHYEKLVANPREEVGALLEYCGLEWDEACLQHHKAKEYTKTASYDQVRQPIYTQSVQRWRNYEKHLKPLIEALGDGS